MNAFQSALEAMAIEAEGLTGDKQPETESDLIRELRQLQTPYID